MKIITPLVKSGIVGFVSGGGGYFLVRGIALRKIPAPELSDLGVATLISLATMISPFPTKLLTKGALAFGLGILGGMMVQAYCKSGKKEENGGEKGGTPSVPVPVPVPVQSLSDSLPLPPLQEQLKDLTDVENENYNKFIKDMGITDVTMRFSHTDLAKFATVYCKFDNYITSIAKDENKWRWNPINPQEIFHAETKKFIQDAIKIATNDTYQKDTLEEANKTLEGCYQSYLKSLKDDKKFNLSSKCTSLLENQNFKNFSDSLHQILKNHLTLYQAEKFSKSTK